MGGLLSILPVVARRVSANARLLAAVVIGAVLASAIMSTTSIYTDAIRDLGLAFAIREEGPDQINLVVRSSSQPSQGDTYARNLEFIESSARQALGPVRDGEITNLGRSATFYPTAPSQPVSPDENRPRAHFVFATNADDQIEVVQGRLPGNSRAGGTAPTVQAAVGAETAARLGISVGRQYDLYPFWALETQPVAVRVVGIIRETDPDGEFWAGQRDLLTFESSNWETIPLFISRETFFDAIAAYLPTMTSDYTSLVYIDTSDINARNAEQVRNNLVNFGNTLSSNVPRTTVTTALPQVLDTFDEKLFFTRIPLLVLVLQIAAIVLYYLFMVSTMLVERQAGEIALLKSRGATTFQVMKIYLVEGLVILVLALTLGPPLAATVISLLGQTPPFTDLSGGSNLQVNVSAGAYAWALGGALLAFITLLLPAYQATRNTIVQQRTSSARPPKQTAFTRYYLDLALVALGGLLLYQLDRRGTLVTDEFFGDQSVDPVVLLTPAFFILTVGLVFLRLFPVVLRLLAWGVSRAQGAAVLIGMWQLVRNPVHYSRLVLLLMLATAVGMFAASFGATLERSYEDRAAYQSGADIRLSDARLFPTSGPVGASNAMVEQLGVEQATFVYRTSGSLGAIATRTSFDMLGVDPHAFADVAFFRDDFADISLPSLLENLGEPLRAEDFGVVLPSDARWLGLWVNPVNMPSLFGVDIEVRDATGRYFTYPVGPTEVISMQPGWNLISVDLSRPVFSPFAGFRPASGPAPNGPYATAEPQMPLTLTSIALRSPTRFAAPSGVIQFDDMHVTNAAGIGDDMEMVRHRFDPDRARGNLPGAQVIADFDSLAGWQTLQGLLPSPLNDVARTVSSGGATAVELRWQPQQGQIATHGLLAGKNLAPLPALASEGLLKQSGLLEGDVTQVFVNGLFIDVQIAGSYNLYPTLNDARSQPSMIVDGEKLYAAANANPRGPLVYPNEVWMKGGSTALGNVREAASAGSLQGQVGSFEELREAQQKDPLVAAGWEGILFISFAAILILSAIGFLIYSYLTAQRRTLEFAVLRTMGFSKRQIALVVGFEQCFVIGLGMIAGTLMGMRLGSLMIRYMGLTETGDEVLPPMELHISWLTIGTAWLVLAAVFLVTIGAVVLLYSRLALHRVLRIGEA